MRCTFETAALTALMTALAIDSGSAQAQSTPYPDPFAPVYPPTPAPIVYPPNILGEPSEPEAAPDEVYLEGYRSRSYTISLSHPYAAAIDVSVPAGSQLWFQGQPTQQKGSVRFFESPPLEPGKTYVYKIKAVWTTAKGEKVERTRTLQIHSGDYVRLDLRKE
jgi:uncharacterized protein (TIGR03000 family)